MTEEIKLLQAAMDGNTAAFEQIVKKYQSLVCAITFSGTGRLDISEELAQETFLSAWKNLRQLKELSGFRPWLCTIARNLLNSYYRKKKHVSLESEDIAGIPAQTPNPSETLITQEEHVMLEQAIMQIPAQYREPLVMFYRQQQSTRQVAVELGLNESTVRTRLQRARQMLREEIAARLERTLEQTAPGKRFTKAVMAGIGAGLAAGAAGTASAAVGAAGAAGAGASTGITAVMSTVTAKVITAAAVAAITIGGVLTYKNLSQPDSELTHSDEIAVVSVEKEPVLAPDESTESDLLEIQEVIANPIETPEISTMTGNAALASTAKMEEKDGRLVKIYVTDKETGQPIEKATVYTTASLWSNDERNHTITDNAGHCEQRWDKAKDRYFPVWIRKDGYVRMSYQIRPENSPGNDPIEIHYAMEKATAIGGIVQNEAGENMANIKVVIRVNDDEHMEKPENHVWRSVFTDENGQWKFDGVPKKLNAVSLKTTIQGYAEKRVWVKTPEDIQLLRDKEYVLVVDKGYSIAGFIKDDAGNPIQGARAQLGDYYHSRDRQHRTHTDENGYFDFTNLQIYRTEFTYDEIEGKGKVPVQYPAEPVTVTADGFAPQMIQVFFKEKSAHVEFVMIPGNPVYGRVIDYEGNPIADATVRADDWQSKYPDELRSIDWNTKTDAEGRFVWQHAPEDEVELIVSKDGYLTLEETKVTPSDAEYEFVLNPKIRVSGQVIDAITKEPITEYIYRRHEGGSRKAPVTVVDEHGKFETMFSAQGNNYIDFQAKGYKPMNSRSISIVEQDVELTVEMHPDVGLSGQLLTPDKKPLAGVRVMIPKYMMYMHFQDEKKKDYGSQNYHLAETDDEGNFHFDPVAGDNYGLVVFHDQGYIYMHAKDFPHDGVFVLQPYGRIEGTYFKGNRPVINEVIKIDYPYIRRDLSMSYWVHTDDSGKFVFNNLITGRARIYSVDPYEHVEVKAGQTHELHIGGDGLTVQGHILNPDGRPLNEELGQCSLSCRRIYDSLPIPEDELPLPDSVDAMSYTGLMEWFTEFGSSDEGQKWLKAMEQKYGDLTESHGFGVDPNGRFEAPNITPGTYLFTATVKPWQNADQFPRRADYNTIIAQASAVFIVPEFDTVEDMDIPIDLGIIQCRLAPLAAGQKAPDFDIPKLKSTGRIKLSDYHGRTVLLNFTNPAQKDTEPDKAALLEQVCGHAKGKTEIINVAMEMLPWDTMRQKMIPECTLPGLYGVATAHNSKIDADYKTRWTVPLPYSVLIDTDGIILWIGEPNEELIEEIENLVR